MEGVARVCSARLSKLPNQPSGTAFFFETNVAIHLNRVVLVSCLAWVIAGFMPGVSCLVCPVYLGKSKDDIESASQHRNILFRTGRKSIDSLVAVGSIRAR